MKSAVFTLCLLGAVCANSYAQQPDYDPILPGEYAITVPFAPLYRSPTDTLQPVETVYRPGKVTLIGRTGRWAVGKSGKTIVYVPGRVIKDLPAAIRIPRDPGTGLVTYSEVVQVPGVTQLELYSRGKVWIAETFKSARSVIQIDEKDTGTLVGKGWQHINVKVLAIPLPAVQELWYTVKLEAKDGRFRYTISQFQLADPPTNATPNPQAVAVETYMFKLQGYANSPARVAMQQQHALDEAARALAASITASLTKKADW